MPAELPKAADLEQRILAVQDNNHFEKIALALFRFQHGTNTIYRSYCDALNIKADAVNSLFEIPFLPISFFKTHNVSCGASSINGLYFESSGTTGMEASRHFVAKPQLYEQSFRKAFDQFFGPVQNYCILGLLPSYLERQHSSLVFMVHNLVKQSGHPKSGFYLYDVENLAATLTDLEAAGQRTLLFGVTYALLDFAMQHPLPLQHTSIIETGGMKGRKKELLREEVHALSKKSFGLPRIHSEYGMTELLSQAYALEKGIFHTPKWMRILIREEDDPLSVLAQQGTGGINIIDLANLYSCAFIATEDVGRLYADSSFEVLGRLDNAEIRGCSLLSI